MSQDTTIIVGLGAFLVSLLCVFLAEAFARHRAMFDTPTWRSSHTVPTPRLGGLGIIAGTWAAFLLAGNTSSEQVILMVAASVLAAVGLIDDVRPLPALGKLAAQAVVAGVLVVAMGATIALRLPWVDIVLPRELGYAVAVMWLVGVVNVWNFMDGLDGIAAGTAAIAAIGIIALGAPPPAMLAVMGSSVGFLVWNQHPATIFMGDSGSMFLGVLIGGSVLATASPISMVGVAVLLAPFLMDAAYTLAMRLRNHRPILSAHHEHLYQRLASTGVPQRVIAAGYWLAAGVCVPLATVYERGDAWTQLAALVVILATFGAFVAFVRERERRFPVR